MNYHALIGGRRFLVRRAEGDEEGTWTLVLGEQRVAVDEPSDLLGAVAPEEKVTADFGAFSLTVWRDAAGKRWYRGAAGGVAGPDVDDDERALWALLDRLGDANAPRACFFCRWSDVEPSTGWGHLGCAVKSSAQYHEIATSPDSRRRKWGAQGLLDWVDEWFSCEKFEVRPKGYGYRGR